MLTRLRALAGVLALLAPTSAAAEVLTLTAEGASTFGLDQTEVFGDAGALGGRPALLTVSYDTDRAPDGVGGFFGSASAGWLDLSLSVDGQTFHFASAAADYYASVELVENGAADFIYVTYAAVGPTAPGSPWTDVAQSVGITFKGDLFGAVDALPLLSGPLAGTGSVTFSIDDLACDDAGCASLRRADGGATFSRLSATVAASPAGVPEPAAWALMILGFGLAGAVARRRRPRTA